MKVNGIRGQLFFAFGALVLVINLFYARLNYLFVEVTKDIIASFLIEQEIEHLQSHWLRSQTLSPIGSYFEIYDNEKLSTLGTLKPLVHEQTLFKYQNDQKYGYIAELSFTDISRSYLIFNASQMQPLVSFTNIFTVFLVSVAMAAMVLAVLSTWFLAGKLSEPLRKLTLSVGEQQPHKRCQIEGADRPDEIGQLASEFNNTYGALQEAWRREHDFANDVSHELRTPIALIRNTLTLNDTGHFELLDRQLLEQATTTLHQTVEVLLALARKENMKFSNCSIRPLIEKAVLAILKSHPAAEFNIEVSVCDNFQAYGNANLIELLFQNLVNNGFYHGDGSSMKIFLQDGKLIFENPIRNDVSRANYQGLGHGQYLVSRIGGAMQWQTSIHPKALMYRVVVQPALSQHQSQKTNKAD